MISVTTILVFSYRFLNFYGAILFFWQGNGVLFILIAAYVSLEINASFIKTISDVNYLNINIRINTTIRHNLSKIINIINVSSFNEIVDSNEIDIDIFLSFRFCHWGQQYPVVENNSVYIPKTAGRFVGTATRLLQWQTWIINYSYMKNYHGNEIRFRRVLLNGQVYKKSTVTALICSYCKIKRRTYEKI